MLKHTPLLLAAALTLAVGCDRRSSSGFRLPPGGDAARGKAAFLALGCAECHTFSGLELPHSAVPTPAPVVLGGTVNRRPSDAYLATSIIYPSYQIARYPARDIQAGGHSRMPHFGEKMTVQQLTDIVAFLQTQYTERPAGPLTPY